MLTLEFCIDALTQLFAGFVRECMPQAAHVAVALSGGIDSVVLLELAARHRQAGGWRLCAVHVHHGLSPNADRWEAFCGQLCERQGIDFLSHRVQVDREAPGGIEAAARAARYEAFESLPVDVLLLAQHADDQAETVLHQALRGTGLKGLAGMGSTRRLAGGPLLCRPLLRASRRQIEEFASQQALQWVEDESNADTAFTRNFIRRELAPAISSRFPHYRESMARLARHAAEADSMLAELARIDLQWDGAVANASRVDGLPRERQRNALYHWLLWQGFKAPSTEQLDDWAAQLFRPPPADRPHRAGGHEFVILRRRNVLTLEPK